jgi:AcrR family transcriptional regulator
LFRGPRQLVGAVLDFVREGIARGEAVILIASPRHALRFRRRLAAEKAGHRALEREGRLSLVDSDAFLESVVRRGSPDRGRFREAALGLLRGARARWSRVRVYDETTDRLLHEGNLAAATRLEALWDEVIQEEGIGLLCGYPLCGATAAGLPPELARPHVEIVAELPSYERLLRAGGELFSSEGFEHATTAAIVRRAATSESQLVKHFGGKEGLLQAIFERWWQRIDAEAERVAASDLPALDRFLAVADVLLDAMREEPGLARLKLLEGRRRRGSDGRLQLSKGLRRFVALLGDLLVDIHARRQLPSGLSIEAIRSALLGAFEGMVRDRFLSRMTDYPAAFEFGEIRTTFRVLAVSLLAQPSPASVGPGARASPALPF